MFNRIVKWTALAWGSASILWESALKQDRERAAQNPLDPGNPSHLAGHELSDMSARLLLTLAITMIVLSFIMHLGLAGGLFYLKRKLTEVNPRTVDLELVSKRRPPPGPRLQANPKKDYQKYLIGQERLLNSYGWTNRQAGIARIPIDRAMEILAHEK